MSECRNVDQVRVSWMNAYPGDHMRVTQSQVGPALAGIGGLVDAVSLQHVALNLGLTHPDVDHVGIGF